MEASPYVRRSSLRPACRQRSNAAIVEPMATDVKQGMMLQQTPRHLVDA